VEKLSKFDFVIIFRPGKEGGKPDVLSRRPDYAEQVWSEDRTTTILRPNQVDTSAIDDELRTLPEPPGDVELAAHSMSMEIASDGRLE